MARHCGGYTNSAAIEGSCQTTCEQIHYRAATQVPSQRLLGEPRGWTGGAEEWWL